MTSTKTQTDAQDKSPAGPVVAKQPETPEKLGGPLQMARTAATSALPPPNGAPSFVRGAEMLAKGSHGPGAAPRAQMMRNLQRSVGNARVSNLIGRAIQTKLSIGAVDDPQEREADRVAETITQPGSKSGVSVPRQIVMKYSLARLGNAQRETKKEEKPAEEPAAQSSLPSRVPNAQPETRKKEIEKPAEDLVAQSSSPSSVEKGGPPEFPNSSPIQRAASTGDNQENAEANIESRITAPTGGQPLPQGLQHKMEAGMGADFSNVRVHDNGADQADAQRLNAKAFTHGSDIWLGPGASANDSKLMAHELTHVVQQGAATQRKPAEEPKESPVTNAGSSPHTSEKTGQHPESANLVSRDVQTIQRLIPPELIPPLVFIGIEGAVAVGKNSTYELKGNDKFEPNIFLSAYINLQKTGALVNVRFGSMASGKMFIEKRGDEYFAAPTALPMTHSDISPPGGDQHLSLIVSIGPGNEITGSIGVTKALPPNSMGAGPGSPEDQERLLKLLIGESGSKGKLEDYKLENELKGGHLNFQYAFLNRFHKGTYLIGAAVMVDEAFAFKGTLHTAGKGLVASDTEIKRDKRGDLIGRVDMSASWDTKDFKGKLELTYEDGVIEIHGTLKYDTPRVKGEVHVLATEESRARQAIESQLASAQEGPNPLIGSKPAPGGPATAPAGGPSSGNAAENVEDSLALVGWGSLKLIITDKIVADAAFVVEPEGYLTLRGTVRSPHKITLMKAQPTEEKHFFHKKASTMFSVIWCAGIKVEVYVDLTGVGEFGPLTLYDITVTGLYSTRPGSANELQISAKLNLSGWATLKLSAGGSVSARIGFEHDWTGANVATVRLDTSAEATARGVMEATPTFNLQKGTAVGDIPKYTIGGELFIGGEVDLTLSGDITFSVPLLHKKIHLGDKVYPIAGFGLTTKAAYTVGSDTPPEMDYTAGKFEQERFIKQIVKEKPPEDKENEPIGSFKEGGKEKGHAIPADVVPDAPPQEPRTQVVQFTMNGAQHSLFLTLGGPHEPVLLEMASKRGPLKPKVAKAEKELLDSKEDFLTDKTAEAKIERRVADLEQAQADATHVEQSATNLGAETGAAPMDVPGLSELGRKFEVYGDRYNVKDLAEPTAGQSPFGGQPTTGQPGTDTEAEDVLSSREKLKKNPVIIEQVRRILDTKEFPQPEFGQKLRQIVENAKKENTPRLLKNLEQMFSRKIAGLRVVLGDLEFGGNKFTGAEFMLGYIGDNNLWEFVSKFEASVEDRRIDAIIRRSDYEFKSWTEFRSGKFLEQIKKDYERKEGLRAVRWVFEGRLGDQAAIIEMMKAALNDRQLARRYGISVTAAAEIIAELERIVIVY